MNLPEIPFGPAFIDAYRKHYIAWGEQCFAAGAKLRGAGEPVAWAAVHFGGPRDGNIYTTCDTREQIEAYIQNVHRSSDSLTLRARPLAFADAPVAAEAPAKGADVALPPLPSCAIQTAGWDGTGVAEYYTADQMRAYALADRQQRKPWPMEEQPDGTVTPVDPIDRQQRGGDDFSGVQPPMRYVAGVNVDVLRRAALAATKGESNG